MFLYQEETSTPSLILEFIPSSFIQWKTIETQFVLLIVLDPKDGMGQGGCGPCPWGAYSLVDSVSLGSECVKSTEEWEEESSVIIK